MTNPFFLVNKVRSLNATSLSFAKLMELSLPELKRKNEFKSVSFHASNIAHNSDFLWSENTVSVLFLVGYCLKDFNNKKILSVSDILSIWCWLLLTFCSQKRNIHEILDQVGQ